MTETAAPPVAHSFLERRFPALSYPNFRLWFLGQIIATFGMWVNQTALGYLVFDLTKSPAYLGYVSFAWGLPTWLFTLYGGVLADRLPRRLVMASAQSVMMVVALVVAGLTFLGLIQAWHVIVFAFISGTIMAFDSPARQAFVLEVVDRKDLANAIAVNSTMFNLAAAAGPAVGGMIYAAAGPGWCFLLYGVSLTAVITALLIMKLKPVEVKVVRASALSDLGEGLRFALQQPVVRVLLVVVGSVSLFGMAFVTVIPAWAVRVLGGDATTNGLLQSARGVGALISAFAIASLGRFNGKGRILTVCSFALPITLLVFSQIRSLPLSLLALVGVGLAFMPIVNLANTLVQMQIPDRLRGRVMSVYTLIFFGMWPMGGLWAGALAQRVNEEAVPIAGGVALLVVTTAVFILFPMLRKLD